MMEQYFIEGYDEKYSIRKDGNVVSHYKMAEGGGKFYRELVLTKSLPYKTPVVGLTKNNSGKYRLTYIITLMQRYFNINPPDKYHKYKIEFKDGNPLNTERSNLKFELNLLKDYPYEIKIFYGKKGNILEKICGQCGDKKKIRNFTQDKRSNKYRHECNSCRGGKNWQRIKNSPILMEKQKKRRDEYNGRASTKLLNRERREKDKKDYKQWYVNELIRGVGLDPEHVTEDMVEVIKLNHLIRQESFNQATTLNKKYKQIVSNN